MESDEAGGEEKASLQQRVRGGAVWSAGTAMLLRLANIAVTAIMARILSPTDFGVFAIAATVFALFSTFSDMGTAAAIRRADMDLDQIAPTVVTMTLVSGLGLAALMAATADMTAAALGAPEAAGPIRVLALATAIGAPMAVPLAQLTREFRQRRIFTANAIAFVPANAAMLYLAVAGSGAMAFAWSRVVGQLVIGVVVIASVPRHYGPGFSRKWFGPLASFGIPLAAAHLLSQINLNIDYAFIARLLNPADVGLYLLAFNIAGWSGALITSAIDGVTVPAISRMSGDPPRLADAVTSALRFVSLLSFPIAAMTCALAAPLVIELYGGEYAGSGPALTGLSLYGAAFSIAFLLSHVLVGIGRTRVLLVVQIVVVVALIPALWIGVTYAGIVGAALAHSFVIILVTVPVYVSVVLREMLLTLGRMWRAVWPPALASALTGSAAWVAASQFEAPLAQLAIGGCVGVAVWLFLAWPMMTQFLPDSIKRLPVLRSLPTPQALVVRP